MKTVWIFHERMKIKVVVMWRMTEDLFTEPLYSLLWAEELFFSLWHTLTIDKVFYVRDILSWQTDFQRSRTTILQRRLIAWSKYILFMMRLCYLLKQLSTSWIVRTCSVSLLITFSFSCIELIRLKTIMTQEEYVMCDEREIYM